MRLLPSEPTDLPTEAADRAVEQATTDEYRPVPWSTLEDHHCFGCSQTNASGLRLRFAARPDGAAVPESIDTRFRLDRTFESYPGIVHGGLIGVICDETMGNLIVLRSGLTSLTIGMRLRYVTAMRVDAEYICVARLVDGAEEALRAGAGGLVRAESEVLDTAGNLVASATATYRPISMDDARQHLTLRPDAFDRAEAALTTSAAPPTAIP
ncbi:PaaI family thioesterase, partial [Frankia canadensis]|uniref:PaaI family thioesterase n=1 Tax=Frankia canadensis TaxID=1836972 RepID=UPI001A9C2FCD